MIKCIFRVRNVLPPSLRLQRRDSFLYRQVSFPPENDNVVNDDEIIVTPFAQILATLKEVRNNLSSMLMRTGEVVRSSHLYKAESMSGSVCVGVQNR